MDQQDQQGSAAPASDETAAVSAEIQVKNLHSEMSRKTQKLSEDNQRLSQQLTELTNQLKSRNQPASGSQSDDEDLETLAYRDPKAYAKKVEDRAASKADERVRSALNQQQQNNAMLNQLISEYPELNDNSSELTVKALEIYKNMPDHEKATSTAYKIAVRDAAAEVGVLPKSKRKTNNNDSYVGGGSGSVNARKGASGPSDVDVKTLEFAERLGVNIKDKKIVERLKQRAARKTWNRYESSES
jgi:predicted transcriptional regulator